MTPIRPCLALGSIPVFQNQPIQRKQHAAESNWRTLITQSDPKAAESAWAAAATAKDHFKTLYQQYLVWEGDRGFPFGQLFDIGRQLVRWCEEKKKPEGDRLPEYRVSGLVEIMQRLSEPLPFSGTVEEVLLEMGLLRLRGRLEPKNPLAQTLAAESPSDRASRIVATTKIGSEAVRKAILESGDLYRGGDERAVAAHPVGISEALRQVYGATKLADELAHGEQPLASN